MTPPETSNGVYRYIFNHMPLIDQEKYQFCFLTKNADGLLKSKEYELYRFPVYKFNNVQRDDKAEFEKEIRTILNYGFDVVHLHTSSWRGFLIEEVAMDLGIDKVIVHSHSTGIDVDNEKQREKMYYEHNYYKKKFNMKYATDLCACSKLAADWLFSDKIPREKIRIMPNAIDETIFSYDPRIRIKIRKELEIENRIVIGNVGRYSFTKNQQFLIECFSEAYKKNNKLFLILIGQGENITKVKALVTRLHMEDNIICFGWENKISEYLQAMDLFCLPSRFEGLPISVIEAQATGLKCLVSDSVTKESNITGNVRYLPLLKEAWIESMLNQTNNYTRYSMDEVIMDSGYSIRVSSKKLCALYDGILK